MTNVPADPRSPTADREPAGFAVGWEQLEWSGDAALTGAMSHRAKQKARGPYRAAVPARIAATSLSLPAAVAAAAEDALMEITRFDAELATALPAPTGDTDGQLAPLAAVLLRTESASSSQIENVTAGAKALALATVGERTEPDAQMVAANVTAMQAAAAMAEELTGAYVRWQDAVTARRDAAVWRVLPMLVRQPAITVRWVHDHARLSQPAAQRAVDQLLAAGVLTPAGANRRNRVWVAEDVITALDDFAARLGRRA